MLQQTDEILVTLDLEVPEDEVFSDELDLVQAHLYRFIRTALLPEDDPQE